MDTIIDNFESLSEEVMTKHAGKWIAIVDKKVVISGNSFKEVNEFIIKNYQKKRALFGKLPEASLIVFSIF